MEHSLRIPFMAIIAQACSRLVAAQVLLGRWATGVPSRRYAGVVGHEPHLENVPNPDEDLQYAGIYCRIGTCCGCWALLPSTYSLCMTDSSFSPWQMSGGLVLDIRSCLMSPSLPCLNLYRGGAHGDLIVMNTTFV